MYCVGIDILRGKIDSFFKINENSIISKGDIVTDDINSIDMSYFIENVKPKYNDINSQIDELLCILTQSHPSKKDIFDQLLFSKQFSDLDSIVDESEKQYQEMIDSVKANDDKIKKLLETKKEYEFDEWANMFNIIDSQTTKYTSSICLLAKDEDLYLDEWITYHLGIGIDHIFIYDNGSKNPISDFIKRYTDDIQSKITVIDFSGEYKDIQTDCYNEYLNNYSKLSKWTAFIDADEFINIANYDSINEFLNQYDKVSVIEMDFVEFNADSNIKYEPNPVRERFTTPSEVENPDYAPKVFVKCSRIDNFNTHYPSYNGVRFRSIKTDKKTSIYLEHYYTKSFEEFKEKIQKGTCDPSWSRSLYEFFKYNPDMEYLKETEEDIVQLYQGQEVTNR